MNTVHSSTLSDMYLKVKSKAVTLDRHRGFKEIKFPRFRGQGTGCWKVLNLTHRPPLLPWYTKGHKAIGSIYINDKSTWHMFIQIKFIGNRYFPEFHLIIFIQLNTFHNVLCTHKFLVLLGVPLNFIHGTFEIKILIHYESYKFPTEISGDIILHTHVRPSSCCPFDRPPY